MKARDAADTFSDRIMIRRETTGIGGFFMKIMDRIALLLTVIGAINWGSIGLFRFDIVAWICGGQMSAVSRVIYTIVGLAGLWCISLFFRERDDEEDELPSGHIHPANG